MRWLTLTLTLTLIRYSQLSVRMMEALNQTRPLAKPKERRGLNLAMQAFLDDPNPSPNPDPNPNPNPDPNPNPNPNPDPDPGPNPSPHPHPSQAFLDEELPRIEAARSTKVEARVVLHLTPPEEAIDESLKQVWVGVRVWVRGRVRVGLANPNP